MLVNPTKYPCAPTIFPYENFRACRIRLQRMLVFVLYWSADLAFGKYYLINLMMAYTCLYSGHEGGNNSKRRFSNLFSIIMNISEYDGFVETSFVRVDFISVVETRYVLSRSL